MMHIRSATTLEITTQWNAPGREERSGRSVSNLQVQAKPTQLQLRRSRQIGCSNCGAKGGERWIEPFKAVTGCGFQEAVNALGGTAAQQPRYQAELRHRENNQQKAKHQRISRSMPPTKFYVPSDRLKEDYRLRHSQSSWLVSIANRSASRPTQAGSWSHRAPAPSGGKWADCVKLRSRHSSSTFLRL